MSYFQQDKILVIAEIGKNYVMNDKPTVAQCLDEAKNLVRLAKQSGADIVKTQTHVFEDEQKKRAESRHEWIKLNESLTPYEEFWVPLKKYCDEIGILFMTTPMSVGAAHLMKDLVTVWKVSSADLTDKALLSYLARTGKPIIISTGMSDMREIQNAIMYLQELDADFAILHCTSIYPCPINKLNLNMIPAMKELCDEEVIGFSDHSMSVTIPVLAIKKGARIIEKHLTIDKKSKGPDHHMCLDFKEFSEMVRLIRIAEEELFAYGSGIKEIYPEEAEKRKIFVA